MQTEKRTIKGQQVTDGMNRLQSRSATLAKQELLFLVSGLVGGLSNNHHGGGGRRRRLLGSLGDAPVDVGLLQLVKARQHTGTGDAAQHVGASALEQRQHALCIKKINSESHLRHAWRT